jgi:hypothetical protein
LVSNKVLCLFGYFCLIFADLIAVRINRSGVEDQAGCGSCCWEANHLSFVGAFAFSPEMLWQIEKQCLLCLFVLLGKLLSNYFLVLIIHSVFVLSQRSRAVWKKSWR